MFQSEFAMIFQYKNRRFSSSKCNRSASFIPTILSTNQSYVTLPDSTYEKFSIKTDQSTPKSTIKNNIPLEPLRHFRRFPIGKLVSPTVRKTTELFMQHSCVLVFSFSRFRHDHVKNSNALHVKSPRFMTEAHANFSMPLYH